LIDLTAEEDDITEMAETLKDMDEVESVHFSSKEDELQELVEGMGEEGQAWALVEQDNPLNHAYVVKAKNPQDTETVATEIEQFDEVYKVVYGQEVVSQLFKFNNYARTIGIALIIGLVLTAVFLIS